MTDSLSHHLRQRAAELRQEQAAGEEQLRWLDERRGQLTETLLRIAGAVQVLEEMIGRHPAD